MAAERCATVHLSERFENDGSHREARADTVAVRRRDVAIDPEADAATNEVKERRKALVLEFLMRMHIDQVTHVRHLETQRSTATNIFAVIATAVLVVIGHRWEPGGGLPRSDLPLTLGLVGLSLAGALLAMKLFERSRVNHDTAEAYRETAEFILKEDMEKCIGTEIQSLPYVQSVRRFVDNPKERQPFEVKFRLNTKEYVPLTPEAYHERIAEHNPIEPRSILIPRHNARAKWLMIPWVKIDTHKSWLAVHLAYGIVGFILTLIALID